jgi:ABC-type phosphate transport system substrate-binding protein
MRVVSKIAVVAAAAATTMTLGLGPALADPPSGTTPALVDVVGVGSDTTQLVMDAIAKSWDNGSPAPAHKIYSWDAVNPTTGATGDTIETKGVGPHDPTCNLARPNGSGAGITALAGTAHDSGLPCIDYARSSRGPQAGDPAGLVWVGYGTDAVSWTVPSSLVGAPTSLTISQLQNIYLCTAGFRRWNSVGGTSGAVIVPVLPQTSSGTRAFFLKAIGVTTPGSCVVNGSINITGDPNNPVPIEENTGVSLKDSGGNFLTGNQFQFNNFQNSIFPYSVADWIAQTPAPAGGGHKTPSSAPGALAQPQPVGGTSPIMTNGSTIDTINPAFTSTLTRTVWNVMPNAGTAASPAIPAGKLTIMFGPGGAVCSRTGITQSYGFGLLGAGCGTTLLGT